MTSMKKESWVLKMARKYTESKIDEENKPEGIKSKI